MKPRLYVFAISHYCEKARWGLDVHGIDYDIEVLAPGLHAKAAKQMGAPGSSLPILVADGETIQGSAAIIDWADDNTGAQQTLTPDAVCEECLQIEARLDDVSGVHVRRLFYSEALVEHPQTVRPIFTKDLALPQKLVVTAGWRVIRKKMIAGMDLGFEQGKESHAIVDAELRWLDAMLADGRHYLVGDQLSRADIAAAALYARIADAENHPQAAHMSLPPRLSIDVENWKDRASLRWIRAIYKKHR